MDNIRLIGNQNNIEAFDDKKKSQKYNAGYLLKQEQQDSVTIQTKKKDNAGKKAFRTGILGLAVAKLLTLGACTNANGAPNSLTNDTQTAYIEEIDTPDYEQEKVIPVDDMADDVIDETAENTANETVTQSVSDNESQSAKYTESTVDTNQDIPVTTAGLSSTVSINKTVSTNKNTNGNENASEKNNRNQR